MDRQCREKTSEIEVLSSLQSLLLRLLVLRMRAAPFAVLLELDLACNKLPIAALPIVDAVALAACESEKLIL